MIIGQCGWLGISTIFLISKKFREWKFHHLIYFDIGVSLRGEEKGMMLITEHNHTPLSSTLNHYQPHIGAKKFRIIPTEVEEPYLQMPGVLSQKDGNLPPTLGKGQETAWPWYPTISLFSRSFLTNRQLHCRRKNANFRSLISFKIPTD